MNFLLDTCVISELVARRPNARVVEWIDGVEEEHLYLSVVTIGEIGKGIAKLKTPHTHRELGHGSTISCCRVSVNESCRSAPR